MSPKPTSKSQSKRVTAQKPAKKKTTTQAKAKTKTTPSKAKAVSMNKTKPGSSYSTSTTQPLERASREERTDLLQGPDPAFESGEDDLY